MAKKNPPLFYKDFTFSNMFVCRAWKKDDYVQELVEASRRRTESRVTPK